MIELKCTHPVEERDQWRVTLYGPNLDIRDAVHSICCVPGITGLQIRRSVSCPDRAEIRFRGEDTWARIKDYLDLEYTFTPIP
jgi:hypothetical protein